MQVLCEFYLLYIFRFPRYTRPLAYSEGLTCANRWFKGEVLVVKPPPTHLVGHHSGFFPSDITTVDVSRRTSGYKGTGPKITTKCHSTCSKGNHIPH